MKTHRYINLSDDELVELYLEGDEKAFQEIYSRYRVKIYQFVNKNKMIDGLSKAYQMEDLIADVFTKAIGSIKKGQYRRNEKFYPWLMSITTNHFINLYRKNKRSQIIGTDEAEQFLISKGKEDVSSDPVDFVKKLMKELFPENDVKALQMISEGYRYEDVSRETNMPMGTVKSRIFHMREALAEKIKSHGLSFSDLY